MPADANFISGLVVRPIGPDVNCESFECEENVDWFLKKKAYDLHASRITRVTCWMDGEHVAGYATTNMTTVELEIPAQRQELGLDGLQTVPNDKYMRFFPALLIGMLGVCVRYGRRGLGEEMVKSAIGKAMALSEATGCRFVTVDSANTELALNLYRKTGFKPVAKKEKPGKPRATVWMYYDLGRQAVT